MRKVAFMLQCWHFAIRSVNAYCKSSGQSTDWVESDFVAQYFILQTLFTIPERNHPHVFSSRILVISILFYIQKILVLKCSHVIHIFYCPLRQECAPVSAHIDTGRGHFEYP